MSWLKKTVCAVALGTATLTGFGITAQPAQANILQALRWYVEDIRAAYDDYRAAILDALSETDPQLRADLILDARVQLAAALLQARLDLITNISGGASL